MRIFSRALLVATVAEFALIASQSSAQYFGVPYYGQPPPYTGTREAPYNGTRERHHHRPVREEVTVTVPRSHEWGATGTQTASLSREVPLYDLDLRTTSGVRKLHDRISDVATTLCSEANEPRNSDCYRNAVRDAMTQAHQVIREARGHDTDHGYGGY